MSISRCITGGFGWWTSALGTRWGAGSRWKTRLKVSGLKEQRACSQDRPGRWCLAGGSASRSARCSARPRASGALCFPPSRALWLQQHLQVLWSHLPLLLNTHLQPLVEVGRVRVRAPRGRPQHVPRAAPRCCGDGHGRVLRQRAWPPARHHPAAELARRVRVAGPCPGAGSAAPGHCDRTGTGRGETGALYYHRRQYQPHPLGLDTP